MVQRGGGGVLSVSLSLFITSSLRQAANLDSIAAMDQNFQNRTIIKSHFFQQYQAIVFDKLFAGLKVCPKRSRGLILGYPRYARCVGGACVTCTPKVRGGGPRGDLAMFFRVVKPIFYLFFNLSWIGLFICQLFGLG